MKNKDIPSGTSTPTAKIRKTDSPISPEAPPPHSGEAVLPIQGESVEDRTAMDTVEKDHLKRRQQYPMIKGDASSPPALTDTKRPKFWRNTTPS
eukprot:1058880-Pyramimonas_sp.AAC.1